MAVNDVSMMRPRGLFAIRTDLPPLTVKHVQNWRHPFVAFGLFVFDRVCDLISVTLGRGRSLKVVIIAHNMMDLPHIGLGASE